MKNYLLTTWVWLLFLILNGRCNGSITYSGPSNYLVKAKHELNLEEAKVSLAQGRHMTTMLSLSSDGGTTKEVASKFRSVVEILKIISRAQTVQVKYV
jgi:hypothetical protein